MIWDRCAIFGIFGSWENGEIVLKQRKLIGLRATGFNGLPSLPQFDLRGAFDGKSR
jgi:hypothetical protein